MVDNFFFQYSKYVSPLSFIVSEEKPVVNLIVYRLYVVSCFFLAVFKIQQLQLLTVIMCLSVGLGFFPVGSYAASWMCRFIYFIEFGMFSAIISSNILSAPFLLSLPFEIPIIHMLVYLVVSHSLLSCVHFSSFFFLLFFQTG